MSDNNTSIFRYIDDSLNATDIKQAGLCIGLGVKKLSYVLFHGDKGQVVRIESLVPKISHKAGSKAYMESYAEVFGEMVERQDWNIPDLASVKIYIDNEHFSLVPNSLFHQQQKKSYLTLNQDVFSETEYELAHDQIPAQDLANVYVIPVILKQAIGRYFPNAVTKHHLSVLLEQLDQPGFFVHLSSGKLDIISLNTRLQFCQTFSCQSREDMLYHITHVSNHLNIDLNRMPITLIGEIDQASADYQFLDKYIGQLELINKPAALELSKEPENFPHHHFYTLFSLKKCE